MSLSTVTNLDPLKAEIAILAEDVRVMKLAMSEQLVTSHVNLVLLRMLLDKAGYEEEKINAVLEETHEYARRIYNRQLGIPNPPRMD